MIVFVGDRPSKKNIDPNIPFVGTQSYKRLLEWIWEMDIDISDVVLCNTTGFLDVINSNEIKETKVIVLGENAEKYVDKFRFEHHFSGGLVSHPGSIVYSTFGSIKLNIFKLPHPSGKNFKINDKTWVKKQLRECKKWLKK